MGIKRLRFFKYFFTGASDWLAEQLYHRGRQQRHNKNMHGWGIASGLRIQPTNPLSMSVVIPAGLAIDPNGEELLLENSQTLDLTSAKPTSGIKTIYIALRYSEQETDEVFIDATGKNEATRVEEVTSVVLLESPPGSPYVEIGRIALSYDATAIRAAVDPNNPQANEIDLRYTRILQGGGTDELFKSMIQTHKHNGEPGQPAKVDLGREVQGALPGSMVTGTVPDSDTVDNIHASIIPEAYKLLPLNGNKKFPLSVIPQGSGSELVADKIDGFDASATPEANKLLALNDNKQFPISVIPQGHGSGFVADKLDGKEASDFAPIQHTHPTATPTTSGFMSAADKQKLDKISPITSELVIGMFVVEHGQTVPYPSIPPGRSVNDYNWFYLPSIRWSETKDASFSSDWFRIECWVNPDRILHARFYTNYHSGFAASANVLVIGQLK